MGFFAIRFMEYVEIFREVDRKKIILAAKASLRQPEGKEALNYLKNKRQFSDEVIDRFDFGYCPLNINHQLRGRIITPIYDHHNSLIAISTRYIDKKRQNRFWHESFDKSYYIYGLNIAKSSIMKHNKAVLVEGEFDVALLHSKGLSLAVGVCGSSFTLFQASLLSRYCSDVFVVFDGDESGKKSIKRTMDLYKKYNLIAYKINYIPVFLPQNEDPDEYVRRQGMKKFKELLKKSREESKMI